MSNLARPSLLVHSLTELISAKDSHLRQDSDNVHYLERTAECSRQQCPVCSTVPLIAGRQDKEVYETCHVIRNANLARSIARDFLYLHKTTRDLSNRLTKCDKLGSCTDEDFGFLECVAFEVVGLCEPHFWTILQLLHCLYLENSAKHFFDAFQFR
jgi:hypothetical protein